MNDNDNQAVATTPKAAILAGERGLQLNDLDSMWRFASAIVKSGLQPKGFSTTEAVLIALQMAAELGMPPLAGLQNIAVINGRPGVYGDAALACVRASGLLSDYSEEFSGQGDEYGCTVTSQRRGMRKPIISTFTVADAKKAKLWGKQGPWTEYPERMLKFRARGFNLRDNFGDVLKGFRTVEEIRDIEVEVLPQAEPPTFKPAAKQLAKPAPEPAKPTEPEDNLPGLETAPTTPPVDRFVAWIDKEGIRDHEVLEIAIRKGWCAKETESVVMLEDKVLEDMLANSSTLAAQVRLDRKAKAVAK